MIGDNIKKYRELSGYTQNEVAQKLGISPQAIYKYEKGIVTNIPITNISALADLFQISPGELTGWTNADESRSDIPAGFSPLPRTSKKPLIGRIACGDPILAEENIEAYVDVPDGTACDFCLICSGDSMIDAGISDGDIVYIRAMPEIPNGEIAAVRIGDEATLKRIYVEPDRVTLMPANARYAPMIFTGSELADVHIEGKAVGFTHWM